MTTVPANRDIRKIGLCFLVHNAERLVADALGRIPPNIWDQVDVVLVIDDCSTDDTVHQALSVARSQSKLKVLRNRVRQYYGGSRKIACQYVLDENLDGIVMLDANGRFFPDALMAILGPLLRNEAEVVLAFYARAMPSSGKVCASRRHRSDHRMLTRLQNLLCGTRFNTFHSGDRAYCSEFLRQIPFWENTDQRHFDTQVLLQAREAQARVVEMTVPCGDGALKNDPDVRGLTYATRCVLTSLSYSMYRQGLIYRRGFDMSIRGRRYFEKFSDPFSSHSLILKWFRRKPIQGLKLLELGVVDASLTKRLQEAGAVVDGVELDSDAANIARPYCRRVYESDLDLMDPGKLDCDYDCVIMADVLEHLKTPEMLLSRIKPRLKVNGTLVMSVPNVANIYVRMNLLLGRWPCHTKGILDRTHLHFYTRESAEAMLLRTGWIIEGRNVTAIPVSIVFPFLMRRPFSYLASLLYALTRTFKGLLGYQFVFYCRCPNKSDLL